MVSVVIVSAEIGPAATANPVASVVTRKPRRDQLARGVVFRKNGLGSERD
jgi:hypothetical protein